MIGGTDIPIIFIATDRRSKSDNLLAKLFSIGVYDALVGSDRSISEVCKLLNKPRTKKEAKTYYRIETEEVTYQAESEDSVSETEIQNILTHYKKLGKDTERYVESFNNIAAQYTDSQLRVISKFLPISVRAVLETDSPKYQSIMTFGEGTYKKAEKNKIEKKEDLKIGFIETSSTKTKPTKPVVIPSAVKTDSVKKLTKTDNLQTSNETSIDDMFVDETPKVVETEENSQTEEPVKKRRGRPKKVVDQAEEVKVPKKRGRPKKVVEEPAEENEMLPGFEEQNEQEDNILPGFDNGNRRNKIDEPFNIYDTPENTYEKSIDNTEVKKEFTDLTRLLTKDKKIVCFVGTAKAGTSFLVNNLADMLSRTGIKTALVDLTENRNSYYIYTKNEEPLRRIASNCLEKIESGIVEGIDVTDIDTLVANLVKKFSLVLLDCDYKTPERYFELAQEIYLVQTMDILTIQPLTAFLRDLQSNNKLEQSKLKAVINKAMKVRGLSTKAIIGGMSCYNNPEMSYMRELFDKEKIQVITIPFDEDTLSKYLSGMVDCFVSTSGYSKQFLVELKKLGDHVYPLITNKFKPEYTKKNKEEKEKKDEWDF